MSAATSGYDIAYEQPQATKVWMCPRWFCNHGYSKPVTCPYHLRDLIDDKLTFDELNRWELFGAHWRVVEISRDDIVVELCTCTDEPVERRRANDPVMIEQLRPDRSRFVSEQGLKSECFAAFDGSPHAQQALREAIDLAR